MIISVRKVSPRRMVLDFRPVSVWAYRISGLLFMAAGVGVALLLAGSVAFYCSRFDGFCHYRQTSPLGARQDQVIAVRDLRGGRVGTQTSGLVASMTLYVMSRGPDLAIPLVSADGATKDSLARELTRFSADTTALEFTVEEDRRVIGYAFGGFLLAAGLVCLLAIERVRLILDRDKGLLQLKRRRFGWSRGVRTKLIKVKSVKMREYRLRTTVSYAVAIILDSGAEVPLTRLPLFTFQSAEQAQQLIKRWLA